MSVLRVDTLQNSTGNVELTIQTIVSAQEQSNTAIALAVALGA